MVGGGNAFDFNEIAHGGDRLFSLSGPEYFGFTFTQRVKSARIATVRPRLGWAQREWLVYVTGGLAWTRVQFELRLR
jgi:hypothetical protein